MGNKKPQPVPEPTEIEPRYITVMSPYPYYANLELPEDQLAMARWLACIVVDPAYLHTLWWKSKSSAPLVIVEISRSMPALERLLGEHKWKDFLLAPRPEERALSSKAYFCHYRTAAHLLREGWKPVDVQDAWFEKWTPQNAVVRFPYPPSSWCDLPTMDPTALLLCRNLPREMFGLSSGKTVVRKDAKVVPGSEAWVAAGNGNAPSASQGQTQQLKKKTPAAPPKSAWDKPLITSSASASKAATPKVFATPLEDDDPAGRPLGLTGPGLTEANLRQHLSWSEDVEEEERIAMVEKEAAAGPLTAGEDAKVWPMPPPKVEAASSGGSDEAIITPVGDDDDGGDDDGGHGGGFYGSYDLPLLSAEDHNHAVAPRPKDKAGSGYAGGAGRSLLEAHGWTTCPVHGPLKNCQIGICEEARAARRRFERMENPGRPRDNLAMWSTGGNKVEVRAVGVGGGGGGSGGRGGGGQGAWRTASHSRNAHSKSTSRPPNGGSGVGGGGNGGAEGGAWRSGSKSAVRVR